MATNAAPECKRSKEFTFTSILLFTTNLSNHSAMIHAPLTKTLNATQLLKIKTSRNLGPTDPGLKALLCKY